MDDIIAKAKSNRIWYIIAPIIANIISCYGFLSPNGLIIAAGLVYEISSLVILIMRSKKNGESGTEIGMSVIIFIILAVVGGFLSFMIGADKGGLI